MKIAIVGAGPVGSYAAYLFSKKGFEVQLFDYKKKDQIGKPVQCTGIFSSEITRFIELKKEFLVNTTKKIQVFSPKHSVILNKEEYILDRSKFDRYLLDLAIKSGAIFYPEHKLKKVIKNNKNKTNLVFHHKNKTKILSPDIVIGADGPNSLIYKYINPGRKKKFYYGVQAVVKENFDSEKYQVFFGKKICPKFFAWIVPESKTKARIGLAALKTPSFYFNSFIERLNIKPNQIIEKQGGVIPIFDPKAKTHSKNVFLLGDSASHVKATTGGGIVPAFQEARKLVNSISRNQEYQPKHKNLRKHLMIRKILNRFSDIDYDRLVCSLSKPRNRKIIEMNSRENPKKLIWKLILQEPKLITFVKYLF